MHAPHRFAPLFLAALGGVLCSSCSLLSDIPVQGTPELDATRDSKADDERDMAPDPTDAPRDLAGLSEQGDLDAGLIDQAEADLARDASEDAGMVNLDAGALDLDDGADAASEPMSCVEEMLWLEGALPVTFQELIDVEEIGPGRVRVLPPHETEFMGFRSGAVSDQGLEPDHPGSAFFFIIEVPDGVPHHYFGLNEAEQPAYKWSFSLKYLLDKGEEIYVPSLARYRNGLDEVFFAPIEQGDVLKIERGTQRIFASVYSANDCTWRGTRQFVDVPNGDTIYRAALRHSNFYAHQPNEPVLSTTILFSCSSCTE